MLWKTIATRRRRWRKCTTTILRNGAEKRSPSGTRNRKLSPSFRSKQIFQRDEIPMRNPLKTAALLLMVAAPVGAQVNAGAQQAEQSPPLNVVQVATFNLPWRI